MLLVKEREWRTDNEGVQYREDATGSFIVPRALEARENRVFARKTKPLGIETLVPTKVDLPKGATDIVFEYSEEFGEAKISTGSTQDPPFAENNVEEEKEKIITIWNGYRYTKKEWKALEFAARTQAYGRNANIGTLRQSSCLKGLNTLEHKIGMFGSPSHGVYGFYNNPEVPPSTASGGFNPLAAATTAQQLLDFYIEELIGNIEDSTELTEIPNTIVQPRELTRKLIRTKTQQGSGDITAFQLIMDNLREMGTPVTIISRNESRAADLAAGGVVTHSGSPNQHRIVVYCRDPEALDRQTSGLEVDEWEKSKGVYSRIMDKDIRGVRWHYPLSAQYVDIPVA